MKSLNNFLCILGFKIFIATFFPFLRIPVWTWATDALAIGFSLKEAKLLSLFAEKQNTIVKREHILINLWGKNDYFLGRSLDVFISKLRKQLKDDENVSLENIRGVGFRLNVTT